MTLQALAQEIGVAFQQAHKYERGQSRISAGRLFHIAKTLDTPITYFFLTDDEAKALEAGAANQVTMNFPSPYFSGQTEAPTPKSSESKLGRSQLSGPGFIGDRRGATAALFAVLLTVLFGFAGLGVDFGIWYTLKRQYQSAADNGAISGAIEVVAGKGNFDGSGLPAGPATTDIQNLAMYAAGNDLPVNLANSLLIDGRSSSTGCIDPPVGYICVNNPPNLGAHTGDAKYVEAIVAEPAVSIFPGIVGYTDAITIRARAVAGYDSIPSCFVGLGKPYGTGNTLSFGGGGNNVNLQLPNCAFVSASTLQATPSNASIYINGNVTITAGAVNTSGADVIKGNSASVTPPIVDNVRPQFRDPYCDATEFAANASSCPATGTVPVINPTYPWPSGTDLGCSMGGATLKPGWYSNNRTVATTPGAPTGGANPCNNNAPLNFSSGITTLCPGTYYLDGDQQGGTLKGAALIIGGPNTTDVRAGQAGQTYSGVTCDANGLDGVTFVAGCSTAGACGGGLSIGAQGSDNPKVNLLAPTTSPAGGLPAEIFFHQVFGTADTSGDNTFGTCTAGASGSCTNGVIHVPATQVTLKGNSSFGSCTEMIAKNFLLNGGATLTRPLLSCNLRTESAKVIRLVE
jgi:Putative Flp pilus-assembly TadE/G-like/Helix-turn-helix